MASQDIAWEVLGWAAGGIDEQCFGEDYGVAVTFAPTPAQTPQGAIQMVPVWQLLITARNPLLNSGPLYHLCPIGDLAAVDKNARPQEDAVRAAVTDGLRKLRALARSKTAPGANGRQVPAG